MKETVFISGRLAEVSYGKETFRVLVEKLKEKGYPVKIIQEHSGNEWCRDYMPVRASDGRMVQFVYSPSYLEASGSGRKTIPDQKDIYKESGLSVERTCKLKLDGGAIEISGRTGIISTRVLAENRPLSIREICNRIKNVLFLDRLVIIPEHPYDFTGHVDGTVRFINEHKVLINDDHFLPERAEGYNHYKKKLMLQFYHTLRASLYNAWLEWEYLPYYENNEDDGDFLLYLNFLQLKDHIFMPAYRHEHNRNEEAGKKLEEIFGKEVIPVPVDELAKEGGMVNCVTWTAETL